MAKPVIYHDPTSEPSRAVHWLCLEAGISVDIHFIWLTKGEHLSAEFLKVNPLHQVPAMKHGHFCLSEATAIMNYLTDINDCSEDWFGHDVKTRAMVNQRLSWYHTNLRKILTLDYFLPALLLPAYLGLPVPSRPEITAKLDAIHTTLSQLDGMLSCNPFLCGEQVSAADILYASDIFALQIAPDYRGILARYSHISHWLKQLQNLPGYAESHKAWNYVAPAILKVVNQASKETPEWVADKCMEVLP